MNLFQYFKDKHTLVSQLRHLQEVTIGDAITYNSETYRTYDTKVLQVAKMYDGEAEYGNFITKTIVDLRAAFIAGGGVVAEVKDKTKTREQEFIDNFVKYNGLQKDVPQAWAKEAEIEGKFLCWLFPNTKTKIIEARFVPYTEKKYKVNSKDGDYQIYESVAWEKAGETKRLEEKEFVYLKFGGRTYYVNKTPSRIANIIRQIENLDKALKDWRDINNLYASPTPYFKTTDAQGTKTLSAALADLKWKIGKFIATTAEFSLVGMDANVKESLVAEITTLMKIVSGATGIPPHFLGYPDLMSNRATASEMGDLITSSTETERIVWQAGYSEIFKKALKMSNETFQSGFDVEAVEAKMPRITKDKLTELVDIWLPLLSSGIVDKDYIRGMIPDIDPEEMAQRDRDENVRLIQELRAREQARQEEEEEMEAGQ